MSERKSQNCSIAVVIASNIASSAEQGPAGADACRSIRG